MKKRWIIVIGLVVTILFVYLGNASWTADMPSGTISLLAHRGVHQTFSAKNLDHDACTANRIREPSHRFLENTLESMKEAFRHGAKIVEFDVHPTTDGHFVVFHDWRLECRTEGKGVTREQNLAYLKKLDIGYGYTADGAKTFPFRGRGVGLMPTLDEVLDAFPNHRFMINVKSKDPKEGDQLAQALGQRPSEQRSRLMVYGAEEPIQRLVQQLPQMRVFTRKSVKDCLLRYLSFGWLGTMPSACRNTVVAIPINWAPYLWGWPRRFVNRFGIAGSEVLLIGPDKGGIDDRVSFSSLPEDYRGIVWTNKVEIIGPLATK